MGSDWITVKEAWALYSGTITLKTFRRKLCGPDGILAERHGLRKPYGVQRRGLMVSRAVILALIEEERGMAG